MYMDNRAQIFMKYAINCQKEEVSMLMSFVNPYSFEHAMTESDFMKKESS